MRVPATRLGRLASEILVAAGCAAAEAGVVAGRLVESDLAGHPSHGVVRVPAYVDALASGRVVAGRRVEVVTETEAMAVLDGCYGFGQIVGAQAVDIGVAKAAASGVAAIGLRHAGHLGRISDWAERAADAGMVSIHFVNVASSALVAPHGARSRRFGTNPIAIGMPRRGQEPLLIDFATSLVAEGKARVARNGGAPLPADALIGPDGLPTDDPRVLYGEVPLGRVPDPTAGPGALRTMGGHKGSALSLACELLAGVLIGSGTAAASRFGNGMLSIHLAPDHFAAPDLLAQVDDLVAWVRSADPADPAVPLVLPGERERELRSQQLVDGVEIIEGTWQQLLATAARVGAALDDGTAHR